MKHCLILIVSVLLLSVVMAACTPSDTPDGGAKEWSAALAANDAAKINDRLCSDKATMKTVEMWKDAFGKTALENPAGKVDLSGLKFGVKNQLGGNSYVTVTGQAGLDGKTIEINLTWLMINESAKWKWCGQ